MIDFGKIFNETFIYNKLTEDAMRDYCIRCMEEILKYLEEKRDV